MYGGASRVASLFHNGLGEHWRNAHARKWQDCCKIGATQEERTTAFLLALSQGGAGLGCAPGASIDPPVQRRAIMVDFPFTQQHGSMPRSPPRLGGFREPLPLAQLPPGEVALVAELPGRLALPTSSCTARRPMSGTTRTTTAHSGVQFLQRRSRPFNTLRCTASETSFTSAQNQRMTGSLIRKAEPMRVEVNRTSGKGGSRTISRYALACCVANRCEVVAIMSVAETAARQPMKCGVVKPIRRVRPALASRASISLVPSPKSETTTLSHLVYSASVHFFAAAGCF